jgi:uncharacterized protein
MKIPVAGLPEGVHEFAFDSPAAALGLDGGFRELHVALVVEKSEREIHLQGTIDTAYECACDRCLKEIVTPLSPTYQVFYVFSEADAGRFDPAETQVLAPGTPAIDIADDVRQVVQLTLPLKILCTEKCKGLCPRCGKNLNEGPCECRPEPIDPRWDALQGLRTNE